MSNQNKKIISVKIDLIDEHEYHRAVCTPSPEGFLEESIGRTGGEPIYPIVVVSSDIPGRYKLISGASRLDVLIKKGAIECEVIYFNIRDEEKIKDLIIDANMQRVKDGRQLKMEFKHLVNKYRSKKGVKDYNRLNLISKETGLASERVKKLIRLIHKIGETKFDFIIDSVFEGKFSLRQSLIFADDYIKHSDSALEVALVEKLMNDGCDFTKVRNVINQVDLNNDSEFEIVKPYLKNEINEEDLKQILPKLNKTKEYLTCYEDGKSPVKILDKSYITDNTVIINGNSRTVKFPSLPSQIACMVGSCEYGYSTKRKGREWEEDHEGLSKMSPREFAEYTANIYQRFIPFLQSDGSVYLIVYDYKVDEYSRYSCFVEYLVMEMEKVGLYLIGRKIWVKNNPLRRQYSYVDAVDSYEYVYRFAPNPQNVYTNPFLFMKQEAENIYKMTQGCTNHSSSGPSNRGTKYFQSNLKKVVNTLDNDYCRDIIRGNVGNPADFFRQVEEEKHSSTSPIYLTSTLILEGSKPGDLIADCWNGVGNTMLSSLLLGRKYFGIEIEDNYYQQTLKKVDEVEKFIQYFSIMERLSEITNYTMVA